MQTRARRIEVPPAFAAPIRHETRHDDEVQLGGDTCAFALPLQNAATRSRTAEQWARSVFEGTPRLLRSCVLFGWHAVLGLRLLPLDGPDQVLGWAIEAEGAGSITLAANSRLLRAQNIVAVDGSVVLWVTVVHYESRAGRALWRLAAMVHHRTIPYLLNRAARSATEVLQP